MQHGRSVLQPLASLSRAWAAAMMRCRPGNLQSSGVSIGGRQRCLYGAEFELRGRVRRVELNRIRETHTILADQWRHECDANISIIARDLSSAHFIGARSASPASSPIAGLARRLLHPLPKPNPVHDWTSHAADAFRYLAMTLDRTVSVRNFSRGLEYPNLGIV